MEMVVSVFVISIAVVGVFQATTRYVQQTKFEKEAYIAALLGQEAVEIVKNFRDVNWVEEDAGGWKNGLTSCSSGCEIDYDDAGFTAWSGDGRFLYIEDASGLYKYPALPGENDVKTIYRRKLTIAEVGDDELDIIVDVYWRTNTTTVKGDIYNWKQ
jgi:hypothetical protein